MIFILRNFKYHSYKDDVLSLIKIGPFILKTWIFLDLDLNIFFCYIKQLGLNTSSRTEIALSLNVFMSMEYDVGLYIFTNLYLISWLVPSQNK